MLPTCFNAGIIVEIESRLNRPDFAGLYPATLAASALLTAPLYLSLTISLPQVADSATTTAYLPALLQTPRHWRIVCNRTRGTPMRVDAISIPVAAQAASSAAMPPSSAASSFSGILASSMRTSAPEVHQDQSALAGTTAKSDFKVGAKPGAEIGAAAGAKVGASLNAKSASKSNAKSDVKLGVNAATAPEIQPSLPTYPVSASLLTTSLTTSPTLAKTVDAPPPPLSAQPVAPTNQITPGAFPLSGTPNASSRQDQPGSTVTSAVPVAVTGQTEALPISNFSQALDVIPANSGAANAPVNAPVHTEASSKSTELPFASGLGAADAAHSFSRVPTRAATAPTQFSTSSASISSTPTVLASLMPASLTPVSQTPVSPTTTTAASTAPPPADSQFDAPIPLGAIFFALDRSPILQSPILQSPSVPGAPFSPAPFTPVELLTQPALSSILKTSAVQPTDQPVSSPAHTSSPVGPTNSAFNIFSATSSARTPAPIPTLQSPVREINAASITEGANAKQPAAFKSSDSKAGNPTSLTSYVRTPTPTPTVQSPIRDISPALASEPANAKQPAASPKLRDSKVATARLGDSTVAKFEQGEPTAAELAPTSGSATLDTAPAQAVSSDVATAVMAQNIAGTNVSSLAPNLTPNSAGPAPTPASIAATTSDAPGNGKPGVSAQHVPAVVPQTAGPYEKSEKKSSAAVQPPATPSHDAPSRTTLLHDVSVTLASGKDSSPTLTAPAPPASAPPAQVRSGAAPELPKTHQMLDSAPPAPPTSPIAPDPAAAQINAQIHVGIRTEAFGAVEIHTVVQQSQVGITVHADRDIAHWFSSELPGLESGLNKSHLNLAAVDFDNGRSGVQTATSFQHGQPQQHFSETPGSQSTIPPDQNTASEPVADILMSDLSVGPAQTHVSIHV